MGRPLNGTDENRSKKMAAGCNACQLEWKLSNARWMNAVAALAVVNLPKEAAKKIRISRIGWNVCEENSTRDLTNMV